MGLRTGAYLLNETTRGPVPGLATLLNDPRLLPKRDELPRPALHRLVIGAACACEVGRDGNLQYAGRRHRRILFEMANPRRARPSLMRGRRFPPIRPPTAASNSPITSGQGLPPH
jgi:hypothetical protein